MVNRYRSGLVAVAIAACLAAACSNSPPPPPDTFVLAVFKPVADMATGGNLCPFGSTQTALSIGTATAAAAGGAPVTQADGTSQGAGATVNVDCSVIAGFRVNAQAVLGGTSAGSLLVNGNVDPTDNAAGTFSASISAHGQAYQSNSCSITPTYKGGPIPTSPPIAPGRIWAHLSCPNITSSDGNRVMVGGNLVPSQCDLEADFLFENCSQ